MVKLSFNSEWRFKKLHILYVATYADPSIIDAWERMKKF